jgi:ribosome-binding factor A
MHNIERINEELRRETAIAIEKVIELEGGLITVAWANCDSNFSTARIGISVLPDSLAGTALEKLRKSSGEIASELKKRLSFRHIPKLFWTFDSTEKNVDSLERVFQKIENNEEDEEEIKYE